ncbi:hypothetical protein DL96DRAFT_1607673 [Flagelloscypha sp. PMI_526]|nr:hypothetical protein DL96DRAFT_1607673 [Flagelloscypha sp. PMI_526]
MFSVKSSFVALTLAASALASHIDVSRRHHQHVGRSDLNGTDIAERSIGKRKSGKFSFYEPEEVACVSPLPPFTHLFTF